MPLKFARDRCETSHSDYKVMQIVSFALFDDQLHNSVVIQTENWALCVETTVLVEQVNAISCF